MVNPGALVPPRVHLLVSVSNGPLSREINTNPTPNEMECYGLKPIPSDHYILCETMDFTVSDDPSQTGPTIPLNTGTHFRDPGKTLQGKYPIRSLHAPCARQLSFAGCNILPYRRPTL